MSATLEQLFRLKAKRQRLVKPYRLAAKPAQPHAAELAYTRDLRRLVGKMGEAVDRFFAPKLRKDDVGAPNDFVVLHDLLSRLTRDELILPFVGDQADRIAAFTTKELARSMGISYSAFTSGNAGILGPTVDSFIADNTSLIRSLGSSYIDRITATLSSMQGERAESVSRALQRDLDVTESRADLIAVDQTLKLNSKITEVRQTQIGVTEYVWLSAHDERVRPDHLALDGTHHSWSQPPPIVDRKTGRREHPGRDFRCRCQSIAVVPVLN